jgi:hypothetical protein
LSRPHADWPESSIWSIFVIIPRSVLLMSRETGSLRRSQRSRPQSALIAIPNNNRVHQVPSVHVCKRADSRAVSRASTSASSNAPRVAVRYDPVYNASASPSGVSRGSRRASKEGLEAKSQCGRLIRDSKSSSPCPHSSPGSGGSADKPRPRGVKDLRGLLGFHRARAQPALPRRLSGAVKHPSGA